MNKSANRWNSLLQKSLGTPEIPGGRGRTKNTSGMIAPSTKHTAARTQAYLQNMNANIARNTAVAANIEAHRMNRRLQKAKVQADAQKNHAVESRIRQARHIKRQSSTKDFLVFAGVMVLIGICMWLTPIVALRFR